MFSPALAALATPLVQTVSSVSANAVSGVQGAFEQLLRREETTANESNSTETVPTAPGDDAAELKNRYETLLSQFQTAAQARLAAAGISLNVPLELTTDVLGRISVVSEHPQRAAIERLLEQDPQLAALVEDLAFAQRELGRIQQNEKLEHLSALDSGAAGQWLDAASSPQEQPLHLTLLPQRG
jgi:hypothetical protein